MVRYCCPLTIALSSCDSPAAQFNLCLSQICLLLVLEAASIPKALCSSRRQISSLSGKMTMSYRSWPNSVLMSAELWVLLSSSLPSLIFQTPTIWALASYTALIHALLWPCPAFQQACSNQQQACVPCSRCKSLTVCFVPPNVKQQLIITGSCGSKVFGRGTIKGAVINSEKWEHTTQHNNLWEHEFFHTSWNVVNHIRPSCKPRQQQ